MSKTFGDLEIGDRFVHFNPSYHARPDYGQENYVKISPRRARGFTWGHIFQFSVKTCVAKVPERNMTPQGMNDEDYSI